MSYGSGKEIFAWPQITGIHEHPSSCTLPIITIMQSHPHVGNGPSFTLKETVLYIYIYTHTQIYI